LITNIFRTRFTISSVRFDRSALPSLSRILQALILGVVITAVTLIAVANQVLNTTEQVMKSSAALVFDSGSTNQVVFEHDLRSMDRSIRRLDRWLTPVRVGTAVFGWVPWVGDHLEAAVIAGEIAETGRDLLLDIDSSKSELFEAVDALRSVKDLPISDSSEIVTQFIERIDIEMARAKSSIVVIEGKIAQINELELSSPVRSVLSKIERQLEIVHSGIELYDDSIKLWGEVEYVVKLLETDDRVGSGESESSEDIDFEMFLELSGRLSNIDQILTDMQPRIDDLIVTMRGLPSLASVTPYMEEVESILKIGTEVTRGALTLLEVVNNVNSTLGSTSGSFVSSPESRQLFRDLNERRDVLQAAATRIFDGISQLKSYERIPLSRPIDEALIAVFGDKDLLEEFSSEVAASIEIASFLIGAEESRELLVLGQSTDELRAMGGFTSSITTIHTGPTGTFSTDLIGSGPFDAAAQLATRQSPPDPLVLYMNAGSWYFRDVGWSPDFRINAEVASRFYRDVTGSVPDAVIAINQNTIIGIASVLGGIKTEQGFVEPDEIESYIFSTTDSGGTEQLDDLLVSLILELDGDSIAKNPIGLFLELSNLLVDKSITLWTPDQDIQDLVEAAGWSGSLPPFAGDNLTVIDSNLGWNKVDRNIVRSAGYFVDLSDVDNPVANLSLSYENSSDPELHSCDVHYRPPQSGNRYENLQHGCYWNYLRVYPGGSVQMIYNSRMKLPTGTSAVVTGTVLGNSTSFETAVDLSGFYFGGLIAVEASSTSSVDFEYLLPEAIVTESDGVYEYRLRMSAQAGSNGRSLTVDLQLPPGTIFESSNMDVEYDSELNSLRFESELSRDEYLYVRFRE